ncbi:hypothetical protein AOLI_G00225300 [Acnodon oligacanthus]
MVWLDIANAYGSVPRKLVEFALKFFHIQACIVTIIPKYFSNLHVSFAMDGVTTGRKWRAQEELDQAISRLQHKEVLGRSRVSRVGLGWGESVQFWSKATREQRKTMVVEEVSQVDHYLIKAVSQGKQGAWTCWEYTINREVTWADIWQTTVEAQLPAAKEVLIIELTIPWEEGMSAAYEYKRLKYSDLAAECREGG